MKVLMALSQQVVGTSQRRKTLNKDLDGKVALVTGASQGIGRAIALNLAGQGAAVVVNYPFDADEGRAIAVVKEIEQSGARAIVVKADVSRVADIVMLFDVTRNTFGGVDIVVSNAGGNATIKPIIDVTEEEYDRATALNGRAHFFVLQQAARHVRAAGRVIYIASSTSAMPYAGCAPYAGAKASGEIYVKVLAKEIGARGITVNSVSPGPTDTEVMRANTPPEVRERAISMTPLGRLGLPEDISDVVGFLATDKARWITGQNLRVGGGLVS